MGHYKRQFTANSRSTLSKATSNRSHPTTTESNHTRVTHGSLYGFRIPPRAPGYLWQDRTRDSRTPPAETRTFRTHSAGKHLPPRERTGCPTVAAIGREREREQIPKRKACYAQQKKGGRGAMCRFWGDNCISSVGGGSISLDRYSAPFHSLGRRHG